MQGGWRCDPRRGQGPRKKLTAALAWSLTYSPEELEYLAHKQAPVLQDAVDPQSWVYWQAYHHLEGARTERGGIPFSEVAGYARDVLCTDCPIEISRLARMVFAMNGEWCRSRSAKNET